MELFCYHFHRKKVIFLYDNEYILDDDLFFVEIPCFMESEVSDNAVASVQSESDSVRGD